MLLSGVITHPHYIILGDMLNASVWGDHPYTLHYIRRHVECLLSGVITHTHYIILGDMLNAPVRGDHPSTLHYIRRHVECFCLW